MSTASQRPRNNVGICRHVGTCSRNLAGRRSFGTRNNVGCGTYRHYASLTVCIKDRDNHLGQRSSRSVQFLPCSVIRVPPSSAVKRQSLAAKRRPPNAANPSAAGENFLMYPLLFSFWALYPFCAVGRVWSIVQVTHMPIPRARQRHRRMLRISWTLQA